MLLTPEESRLPTDKPVNKPNAKQHKDKGETVGRNRRCVNKGTNINNQKEKLPPSNEQVTIDTDEGAVIINIPNEQLPIIKNIIPPKAYNNTDTATGSTTGSNRLDTESKVHSKIPIYYLFSLDTISTTNHCCLRMMKAAKTCLLKNGYNVAGCFVSIKNVGCLET